MGLEYYAFAFYVFLLICVIILLCRALFSKVRKQKMLFDEKEAKLLKLYQTVEDAMDEFFDMAADSKAEMDETFKKMSQLAGNIYKNANVQDPAQIQSTPEDKISEVIDNKSEIKQPLNSDFRKTMVDVSHGSLDQLINEPVRTVDGPSIAKNDTILRLFRCGKPKAQIAQELNITQNEVDLVIEMNKNSI